MISDTDDVLLDEAGVVADLEVAERFVRDADVLLLADAAPDHPLAALAARTADITAD